MRKRITTLVLLLPACAEGDGGTPIPSLSGSTPSPHAPTTHQPSPAAASAEKTSNPAESRPRRKPSSRPPVDPQRRARPSSDYQYRLVSTTPPAGEKLADKLPWPACAREGESDETTVKEIRVRTSGRSFALRLEREFGGNPGVVGVYENGKRLWSKHVGSAGGGEASEICASDGWAVVVAGHYRHGNDVYDLLTGDKLGPGDITVYAPDLSYGLSPPSFGWGNDCYRWSRTFRVATDGSRRPYPIDTPPVPRPWTCESHEEFPNVLSDPPSAGIAPDGRTYAVASPVELGLYRAADDKQIARFDDPPYDYDARDISQTRVRFSSSGQYVVLKSERKPRAEHWFRIERDATRPNP
jgi:hypothetical protein